MMRMEDTQDTDMSSCVAPNKQGYSYNPFPNIKSWTLQN